MRRYASAVYAVIVYPSVCHKLVLYRLTEQTEVVFGLEASFHLPHTVL